jgi:putative transposase
MKAQKICRELGIVKQTFYKLKAKFGGMDVSEAKRLRELEEESSKLKRLLAEAELDKAALKEVLSKRTYRLYTECSLQIRTKKRKKLVRPRMPMILPSRPNERWSIDFVHDQLSGGRRFRVLNIVDDCTRECVGQPTDLSISGYRVARFLKVLMAIRGKPKSITCDNGTEFTSKAMFFWSQDSQVRLQFIQPGKPTQNAFVESFNGKIRDSCLNQYWFRTLDEARKIIDDWRKDYNDIRPHSSLNYQPPMVFAKAIA